MGVFLSEDFQFLEVKFSVYLIMCVFRNVFLFLFFFSGYHVLLMNARIISDILGIYWLKI